MDVVKLGFVIFPGYNYDNNTGSNPTSYNLGHLQFNERIVVQSSTVLNLSPDGSVKKIVFLSI